MEPGPKYFCPQDAPYSFDTDNWRFQSGIDRSEIFDAPYTPNGETVSPCVFIAPGEDQAHRPPVIYQAESSVVNEPWHHYPRVIHEQIIAQQELVDHDYLGISTPTFVELSGPPQHQPPAQVQHQSKTATGSPAQNIVTSSEIVERLPHVPDATVKVPKATRAAAQRNARATSAEKLEKKRARNKAAAARCRERRLKNIERLQQEVENLVKENTSLEEKVRHLNLKSSSFERGSPLTPAAKRKVAAHLF